MVTLIDQPLISAYLSLGNVWILCGGKQLSCSAEHSWFISLIFCQQHGHRITEINARSLGSDLLIDFHSYKVENPTKGLEILALL